MAYEKGLIRTDRGLYIDKGNHRYDPRHPDFGGLGADPDGLKDSRSAFADCDAAASDASAGCFVGPGTYLINSDLTLSQDWTLARGVVIKPASGVTITFSGSVRGEGTEAATFDTSLGGSFTASTKQFGIVDAPAAPPDAQYVVLTASDDLSGERVLTAGTGITLTDDGAGSTVTVAAPGLAAEIVTLTASGDLANERVLTAGTAITITDGGAGSTVTIDADVMTGADGVNAGTAGIVPAPAATDNNKFLRGDGTWADGSIDLTAAYSWTGAHDWSEPATFGDKVQGTTANGFLDLYGDSGATSGVRIDDSGRVLVGTTVTTNSDGGDIVIQNTNFLRAVNAAGSGTHKVIGRNASDQTEIQLNSTRLSIAGPDSHFSAASTPANFSASHRLFIKVDGDDYIIPLANASW